MFFFVFIDFKLEMIVCFVDTGGIVDHHYISFHNGETINFDLGTGMHICTYNT
jgi:hypothetical protein